MTANGPSDETDQAAREDSDAATEPLQPEARYRRQSELLAVILGGVADGITAQGRNGELLYANDAAARWCGFANAAALIRATPEQIEQRFEVFDEHGQRFDWAHLPSRRALAGEGGSSALLRFRRKVDGAQWWSQIESWPVRDEHGEPYLVVNIWHDVTEQRRRERDAAFLADATAMLSSGLDSNAMLDQLTRLCVPRLADWCAAFFVEGETAVLASVTHVDPAKVRYAFELNRRYPPEPSRPHGVAYVVRTGRAELIEHIPDEWLVARMADPEHVRMARELGLRSAITVPLRARGRIFGALGLVGGESRRFDHHDLALAEELGRRAGLALENARLYQEAEEAVRARDDFMAIAGHELKTPLAALLLQVSGLLRLYQRGDTPSTQRALERLHKVAQQATRIDRLIEELLDVSRITSGRLRLEREEVDLAALAGEVARRFDDEAARTGSSIDVRVQGQARGRWDPQRLEQALANLVSNALKYGAARPVLITVDTRGPRACVAVRDHGAGVPPEQRARMFGRFERAVAERSYGSYGLGLWLTRQLIEAHGGSVHLDSKEGQGSTFTIELPLVPD